MLLLLFYNCCCVVVVIIAASMAEVCSHRGNDGDAARKDIAVDDDNAGDLV